MALWDPLEFLSLLDELVERMGYTGEVLDESPVVRGWSDERLDFSDVGGWCQSLLHALSFMIMYKILSKYIVNLKFHPFSLISY